MLDVLDGSNGARTGGDLADFFQEKIQSANACKSAAAGNVAASRIFQKADR